MEAYLKDNSDLQSLPLNFVSPDIEAFRQDIETQFGNRAIIFPNEFGLIHAGHLGALPLKQVDVDTFIPDYAKLSEAEENWVAQNPEEAKADEGTYVERTN